MSEFVKKIPNAEVVQWFNQQQIEQLYLSSVTIAEIKKAFTRSKTHNLNDIKGSHYGYKLQKLNLFSVFCL